ncbi:hypothetical protein A3K72_03115 [Candidatus Woesearchaeota archaeon RBG_13_36_6]|nr:MAG: hypothetical protein A3K72_03115 [Candidatus Woesearchaeota archaeon RBG_13_36_6]
MLPYKSFISWEIGPLTIQSFGVMFAIAIAVGVYLALKQFKTKQEKENGYNIALLAVIFGLIGSRMLHVLQYWDLYKGNWFSIINFIEGGLIWYGGLIGGLFASIVYIKIKKLDFWKLADIIAPSLAIGQAIGRIGCILGDGGHVGKLTTMPWGFNVNGEIRHVTAWYSMINLFVLFFLLLKLRKRKPFTGFLFLFYLFYYSITTFVIDIYRTDPRYYGFTLTQYICVLMFLISGSLLFLNFRYTKKKMVKKKSEKSKTKKSVKTKEICPSCKSKDITLFMGGIFGKYKCKKCGYIGPLVVEEEEG